jgi:hypothetical protein
MKYLFCLCLCLFLILISFNLSSQKFQKTFLLRNDTIFIEIYENDTTIYSKSTNDKMKFLLLDSLKIYSNIIIGFGNNNISVIKITTEDTSSINIGKVIYNDKINSNWEVKIKGVLDIYQE